MTQDDITLLVLAGGQGRRMGGVDKGWICWCGQPLIVHVLSRLAGQAGSVLINANRTLEAYERLGYPVITDLEDDFKGPLMGILSGLSAASTPWVLVVPCDTPALPEDLVVRMIDNIGGCDIAVAHDGERAHPVIALIRRELAEDLREALAAGERKIDRWYERHVWCHVDFSDQALAFTNLNTPEDKTNLAQRLERDGST
ncbi:molybdenum cofactor guanylyltransferase MobA [Halomonas sp. GXIMD04776]|uniref:molybdenum cofactor guanylyltransferase MobA n=1 Tax=Halomonas sp. GXIMD04776 TaxID=3415605 RepID=UPI003C8D009F